jgi:two-component system NtrC family response regulator
MAEGKQLGVEDLGLPPLGDTSTDWLNLRAARQRAEIEAINQAIAVSAGNLSRTAELLGITRPTLYDLLQKNEIAVPDRAAEG